MCSVVNRNCECIGVVVGLGNASFRGSFHYHSQWHPVSHIDDGSLVVASSLTSAFVSSSSRSIIIMHGTGRGGGMISLLVGLNLTDVFLAMLFVWLAPSLYTHFYTNKDWDGKKNFRKTVPNNYMLQRTTMTRFYTD